MNRFTFCFLSMLILMSCANQESEAESSPQTQIVNGVERSELALLMRKMYDQMKLVGDSLENGSEVRTSFYDEFSKITSAHATEPEKIDKLYQAMASAFLENYETFETDSKSQVETFNIMIDNCLVCHERKCPGPYKSIKRLRIKPRP